MSLPEKHTEVNTRQHKLFDLAHLLNKDKEKVKAIYGDQIDELQEKLASLIDDNIVGAEALNELVLDDIANFLSQTNLHEILTGENISELKELLNTSIDEIDELSERSLVPQEFFNLSSRLGYGTGVMSDYYQAYMSCHEDCRLEIPDISSCLREMDECLGDLEFCAGLDKLPMRDRCMAEAFSYLINGDVVSFERKMEEFNLEIEYYQSKKALEENNRYSTELMEYQKRLENISTDLDCKREELYLLKIENPYWAKFWREDEDDEMSILITEINALESKIKYRMVPDIASIENKMRRNNLDIVAYQYRYAKVTGVDQLVLDRMILDMYIKYNPHTFDDFDLVFPEDLLLECEMARERILLSESEEVSVFEKAYYEDDYDFAMEIAVDDYNFRDPAEDPELYQQQLMMVLNNDPDISYLKKQAEVIYTSFAPISRLMRKVKEGDEMVEKGNISSEYMHHLKSSAQNLKDNYHHDDLLNSLDNVQAKLESLRTLYDTIDVGDEFDKMLDQTIESLEEFQNMVYENSVGKFCDSILDDTFTAGTFSNWCIGNGFVLSGAIVGGLLMVTIFGAPAGTGVLATVAAGASTAKVVLVATVSLASSAALMAAGSVGGMEVGRAFSPILETNFTKYSNGEISFNDLVGIYSTEFALSWGTTLFFLGAAKLLVGFAAIDVAVLSSGARKLEKAASSVKTFVSRTYPGITQSGPLMGFSRQFAIELAEEIAEDVGRGVNPLLGGAITFWNSLDGRNLDNNVGPSAGLVEVSKYSEGRNVETRYEYSEGNTDMLHSYLQSDLKSNSDVIGTVTKGDDGEIIYEISIQTNGKKFTNKKIFNPTSESLSMRQTLRKSTGKTGDISKSVLKKNYGVEYEGGRNNYTYDSLKGGKLREGLIPYLEADGYIITNVNADGSFEARKGKDVVNFRSASGDLNLGDLELLGSYEGADYRPVREIGPDIMGRFERDLFVGNMNYAQLRLELEDQNVVNNAFQGLLNVKSSRINEQFKIQEDINLEAKLAHLLGLEMKILTVEQKRAILLAHYQGTTEGRGLGDYNSTDIAAKARLLSNDFDNSEQRRVLIEDLQLAGVEKMTYEDRVNNSHLNESQKNSLLRGPNLAKFEYLKELHLTDSDKAIDDFQNNLKSYQIPFNRRLIALKRHEISLLKAARFKRGTNLLIGRSNGSKETWYVDRMTLDGNYILISLDKTLERVFTEEELIEWNNTSSAPSLLHELYPSGLDTAMEQGEEIGHCYLIASLKVLKGNPRMMQKVVDESIKKISPGVWKVTFLGDHDGIGSIRVTQADIYKLKSEFGGLRRAPQGDLILESAYASYISRIKKEGRTGGTLVRDEDGKLPVEGGFGHIALYDLLGPDLAEQHVIGDFYYSSLLANDPSLDLSFFNSPSNLVTANTLPKIGSDGKPWSHAYAVLGFDASSQIVYLADPHNTALVIEMNKNDFLSKFSQISYVTTKPF